MRDEKKVRIIIAGLCNTGKSTVAQIIGEALLKADLDVEVVPVDKETPYLVSKEQQLKRIAEVKKSKVKIQIEERFMYNSVEGGTAIIGLKEIEKSKWTGK